MISSNLGIVGRQSAVIFVALMAAVALFVSNGFGQVSSSPIALAPTTPQTGFGNAVAVGDVNGDGRADIVVGGAVLQSVGGATNAGKAYVFLGGNPPSTPLEFQSPRPEAEARFGWAVAIADLNADGLGDVIASALFARGGLNGTGETYVFFGSRTFAQKAADVTLATPMLNAKARLGWSIAAGDVNGDRIADVIVSAENATVTGRSEAGQVFIYPGSPNFTGAIFTTLQSPSPQEAGSFGNALAVGDVNRDGFDDIISGAPGQNVGNIPAGLTYVFNGGVSPSTVANSTLAAPTPGNGDRFGFSVAVGDVNGDRGADVVVGASQPGPRGLIPQPGPGRVFVYFGGIPFDTAADSTITHVPLRNGSGFGQALATGDINRDGVSDIVVGIPLAAVNNASNSGEVNVFLGGLTFDTTVDLIIPPPSPAANALFGAALAVADVTGDGRPDIVAGEPRPPIPVLGGAGNGKVYVYPGQ